MPRVQPSEAPRRCRLVRRRHAGEKKKIVTCDKKPEYVETVVEKSPKSHQTLSRHIVARTSVKILTVLEQTERKINVVKVLPARSKMSHVPVSEAAGDHERVGVREGAAQGSQPCKFPNQSANERQGIIKGHNSTMKYSDNRSYLRCEWASPLSSFQRLELRFPLLQSRSHTLPSQLSFLLDSTYSSSSFARAACSVNL